MTDFILGVFEITIGMSLFIALLLLGLKLFGGKFTAKCRYIIWALVMLRLAIPFSFGLLPTLIEIPIEAELVQSQDLSSVLSENTDSVTSVQPSDPGDVVVTPTTPSTPVFPNVDTANPGSTPILPVTPTVPGDQAESVIPSDPVIETPTEQPVSLRQILDIAGIVYLIGAAIFLVWSLVSYFIYTRKILRSAKAADERTQKIFSTICKKYGMKKQPTLLVASGIHSPAAFGIFRRKIVLPDIAFSENGLVGTLAHEVTHCKRGDLYMKLVELIACSLNWFNPLVHIAAFKCEMEMELSCDEKVLSGSSEAARAAYADVMLDIIRRCRRNRGALTTHFNPKKSAVTARFKNILYGSGKRRGRILIGVCLVLCILAGAFVACQTGDDLTDDHWYAEGYYLKCDNGSDVIVMDADGANPASPCQMTPADDSVSFEGLTDGDRIKVEISMIMTTYPGQTEVYSIEKLSDGERDDIDPTVLDNLREIGWIDDTSNQKELPNYLEIPAITLTQIETLPYSEETAVFTASPVGGNPTIFFFDDSRTFYFRKYLSTNMDAEYFTGTLTLPNGFTDAKLLHVTSGAGSGEIFVSIEAIYDGKKEYLTYGFFGTEAPSGVDVLDEVRVQRLMEAIAYSDENRQSTDTQGPFIGYVADSETPWIDLYTEKNGDYVGRIPYEIFHDWIATDRDREGWEPGWEPEYIKFYYAEFGDFRWAAAHLTGTTMGNGRKNVATSSDGGNTWNVGSTADDYGGNHVVGIGFASESIAFMSFDPYNEHDGADGPIISRTIDGGKTWELLDISVPPAFEGKKLIAGIPYYNRNDLFYPIWLNTSHGTKEGEPMYLVSRDKGFTWSWDSYSLPAEATQYVVDIPMEDERDFITVAGVYGKGAEPNYPDGATIHAGKDGTLYYVMGVGNDGWSRGNFKALRTYRVTSKSGYLESVEEVETFTKDKVLKNGKPYTGDFDGMFTCQAYRFRQGNFNYDFLSHTVYIQSDGTICANSGLVGTGGPIGYEGTYQYDVKTGDFSTKLIGRYANEGEVTIYPEAEVQGKLYEYGGFVHFVCESSGIHSLMVNDPIPLTFVPNTDGYATPALIVLDDVFDGTWEGSYTDGSGEHLYGLAIVTESAQIQFDDGIGGAADEIRYVGTYTVNPLTMVNTAVLRSLSSSGKESEFTIKFTLGYSKGTSGTFLYFDVRACDAPSLQHLVGKTLVFEDTTVLSTMQTTENIFQSVLENKASFTLASSKENVLLSEYKANTGYSVKKYTVLDLNDDRDPEMVLWLGYGTNDYAGFLVLHRDGDTVYAHSFPYRGFNGLNGDGVYTSSSSAFNMSILKLDFDGDTCTETVLARREGDGSLESIKYYIADREVKKDEFESYYKRYDSRSIPDWYSSDIETITNIDDWHMLLWAEYPSEDDRKPSQNVYNFIYNLVSGESDIPEINGLGIKDYSIALLKNSAYDSLFRFIFTVTGNSLPETLPPGTYSWTILDGLDLSIYRDSGPDGTVSIGRAHGLNEFGEYSAVQAVDTYLCWMPYIYEVSPYGAWDMTNSHLPYNYICAYYGKNLEISFSELQNLMSEKFGIEVERPEKSGLLSRCEYDKERDTVRYADTRGYEAVHRFSDVREEDGITYVTVMLFADKHYLIPSHTIQYKIGEGDVFLGCEIIRKGNYTPRELS